MLVESSVIPRNRRRTRYLLTLYLRAAFAKQGFFLGTEPFAGLDYTLFDIQISSRHRGC